jgi:CheY-like chemotaxis protein
MMPEMDGFELTERVGKTPSFKAPTMIMVSSAARPGDAERCRRLGIARHLIKPVVQSELLDTILHALRHEGAEESLQGALAGRPPAAVPTLRILLAEDGLVNQRVAMGLLKKHGHQVVLANNGREAVESLDKQSFDGILMDVQMPEMDGFEATAAIREREQRTGRHIPIIAMTASAMKGDRERCLAAGMDGYVSKPIDPEQLYRAVATFAPARARAAPEDGG